MNYSRFFPIFRENTYRIKYNVLDVVDIVVKQKLVLVCDKELLLIRVCTIESIIMVLLLITHVSNILDSL